VSRGGKRGSPTTARGIDMGTAVLVGQVLAALGIFNVWIIRFGKATNWRGGDDKSLKDEFQRKRRD
jgi:hypothetical protein